MMAGLLSLLRLDPMFSIYQKIGSWAQKNGHGDVPRSPETPRNSRTLRDRSRGAFFVIVNAPGPMPFIGTFIACVLLVILMHWCAFGDLYLFSRGARYDWLIATSC